MYLVYSIHPTTFKVTARSVHRDHDQAVSALVKQSFDYITKYRGHKDLQPAKNLADLEAKPVGFYYVIADDIDDRLTIYEKKTISEAGYVYQARYEVVPYLIFSFTLLPFFDPKMVPVDSPLVATSVTTPKNVDKLENIKPDVVQTHHSNYMSELHTLLQKRGGPVETEAPFPSDEPAPTPSTEPNLTPSVDPELMSLLDQIEKQ